MNRGIRGATTVENDSEQEIVHAAEALIREIADKNNVQPEMIVSVFISMTPDLKAAFPAKALRKLQGWDMVPVTCMQEIDVPNSLPKCIRVMLTAETELKQNEIKHIYHNKAVTLRPDLAAKK